MKKFIVLYIAPVSAMEQMANATPEQAKAGMDAWTNWGEANAKGLVDMGAPLGSTKKVTGAGVSDTKNEIAGYSIVQGSSFEEVTKMFEHHPHLMMGDGASIEIIETVDLPPM